MKRLKFLTHILALVLLTAPVLYSCLDDGEDLYTAITTVKTLDGNGYYFNLENGKKMYPTDTTEVRNYHVTDGQRAIVWFEKLENSKPGYEYNIKVRGISDILTKKIIPLTEATADSIGDSPISIYGNEFWIAQGYLTIRFYFLGTYNPTEKHMLNLVRNETVEQDDDGYIHLEFRHNAYNDPKEFLMEGYVSFKLDEIAEEMKTAKGLRIRVNSLEYGERIRSLEFRQTESAPAASTSALQGAAHTTGTFY